MDQNFSQKLKKKKNSSKIAACLRPPLPLPYLNRIWAHMKRIYQTHHMKIPFFYQKKWTGPLITIGLDLPES